MAKNERTVQFILPTEGKETVGMVSSKGSLNPADNLLLEEKEGVPESLSSNCQNSFGEGEQYRGRLGRQVTINAHPSRDNKFFKVILPYNFDKKKYWINYKEIAFYENKKYIQEKLAEFNKNENFDIDKNYSLKAMQKVCLYVPTIFLSIIVLYIALIASAFFSFNPIVIYTLYTWLRKGYNSLQMFKFILLEKFKIKEIHKILAQENASDFCVSHKLKWILGLSGYWLEVQKLLE